MDFDVFNEYVSGLPYVEITTPFGPDTLVYKLGGKVFLLIGIDELTGFNVKCDPEYALELREQYQGIIPGWHMNKKHWNTIQFDNDVPWPLMKKLIEHSYQLIYNSLPKKIKDQMPL